MTDTSTTARSNRPAGAGAFPHAWTVARVRGVPIRIDRSWLLIAGFLTYLFFGRLAIVLRESPTPVVVAAAVAAVLLFFASVLAHELGHTLTSLDRGIPVLTITLFAMGGVTESTREARSARDEFVIVGIGPFISLVLGAAFGLVAAALEGTVVPRAVAGYLAWANIGLAIFNIVPGYPLDGGRLLRAVLWGATGQPHKATRWAARVGQVFAALVIGIGILLFVDSGGRGLGGLWEVLIGFFLLRGATDSHRRARTRERVGRRTVADVMGSVPAPLSPTASLAEAIVRVQERPSLLWPVGDPVSAVLRLAQLDAVPADRWAATTVGEVAGPADAVTVEATTPLDDALERMASAPGTMLLVVRDGRAVGLLTPSLAGPLLP